MKSIIKTYRIDRKKLYYVRFILEAYDGIAIMSSIDASKGIVKFLIAPGSEKVFELLLNDFKKKILIESYKI